jgi:hypothetical protein
MRKRNPAAHNSRTREDVLEQLGHQLASGGPRAAVDELLLERREEALGDGVVVTVALGAHRASDPGVAGGLADASETYWLP